MESQSRSRIILNLALKNKAQNKLNVFHDIEKDHVTLSKTLTKDNKADTQNTETIPEVEVDDSLSNSDDPFIDSASEYVPPSDSSPPHSPLTPKRNSNKSLVTACASVLSPLRSRKRKANPQLWKRNVQKVARNGGNEYVDVNEKKHAAKEMGPGCSKKCKLNCHDRITEENRKYNFNKFYALQTIERQWQFVANHCEVIPKKSTRVAGPSRRTFSRNYSLVSLADGIMCDVRVCTKMFLDTLAINSQNVKSALKKKLSSVLVSPDKRGKHIRKPCQKQEAINRSVVDHISLFPAIESHYLRKQTSRKFIDGNLTVSKMHRLYLEWFENKQYEFSPANERQYRDIFNNNFNIGFHIPKKDQCDMCVSFENLPEAEKQKEMETQNEHLKNKNQARLLKTSEKEMATASVEIVCACFDFQKVLPTPRGDASIFYYKRKLSTYNFTIYNMSPHLGYCFVWDETIGGKGSNEVASCLYKFIVAEKEKGITSFFFWSDNCNGQNKNKTLFVFYSWICKKLNINISHKFLEKGHTQNEGDSVHSTIERACKGKTVYVPQQWYSLMRGAKTKNEPYCVIEMDLPDFLNFKDLIAGLNTTKNTEKEKIYWSQIREVFFSSLAPNNMSYKTSFDSPIKSVILYSVDCDKATRKRRSTSNVLKTSEEPQQLNKNKKPISEAKYKDLMQLFEKNVIPKFYKSFYENLPHSDLQPESSDKEDN